ncbi:UvrD-helicase domain-containing protein [Psychromonas sp. SR45-3]|uniref:UvrD-helicase domain-containing protein n=1 Tax=Psychromonas sp. SR45-3 TaxID=2760930 RepID=UPI0015FC62F7|nr:UvrD-helicase domain-containing protein [Psychromonas sp. SR45-3]MBB1272045.1 ATP-dependent helicase [Psychromonas sp. SR45-3]
MLFISKAQVDLEIETQNQLNEYIENNTSFIFNAGAGAGKTYALVATLKRAVQLKSKKLQRLNQQIVCITYTNVATNQIRKRLGNNDLIHISTIHEFAWKLIKNHQNELVPIHKEQIKKEIDNLNYKIDEYITGRLDKKNDVEKFLLNDPHNILQLADILFENKEEYYLIDRLGSSDFKAKIEELKVDIGLVVAVTEFKKLAKYLIKKQDLQKCLIKIDAKEVGYTKVKYQHKINRDILYRMLISHDTLLVYMEIMLSKYDKLKQITANKYPIILIDEYQDSSEKVINSLKYIDLKNKNNFMLGFFGDPMQNIYDTGIGSRLNSVFTHLQKVEKKVNRRSSNQIIDVANSFRTDGIIQKSIYENFNSKEVKLFHTDLSLSVVVPKFIEKTKKDWKLNDIENIHCLVLKNKTLAELNGFGEIYEAFYNSKLIHHDELNGNLLSHELTKLNPWVRLIYQIMSLFSIFKMENISIGDLVGKEKVKILVVRRFYEKIKKNIDKYLNISDFLIDLDKQDHSYQEIISYSLSKHIPELQVDSVSSLLVDFLKNKATDSFKLRGEKEEVALKELIEKIVCVDIKQWFNWFTFISKHESSNQINYHTWHGTKGEEYDNVIIIMERNFQYKKQEFISYFSGDEMDNKQIENLLYVAHSRAKKHLRVLFIDSKNEIQSMQAKLKSTFNEIVPYN